MRGGSKGWSRDLPSEECETTYRARSPIQTEQVWPYGVWSQDLPTRMEVGSGRGPTLVPAIRSQEPLESTTNSESLYRGRPNLIIRRGSLNVSGQWPSMRTEWQQTKLR